MSKIMAVGIATIDIINDVDSYPEEDSEVRICSQSITRGGNATNTLVILSQLGHNCFWAGTLAQDSNTKIIIDNLNKHQIDHSHTEIIQKAANPTSYILLSRDNSSRSITHYRDLIEYSFNSFSLIQLHDFDWLHFEGRNVQQVLQLMAFCKTHFPNLKISLEVEKNRPQIECLFNYADVLLFSKQYAISKGFYSADSFLQQYKLSHKTISCAWGMDGASLYQQGKIYNSPAYIPDKVVDTIAAGDTFNSAIIHSLLRQKNPQQVINYACQLAGEKCALKGLDLTQQDCINLL